MLEDWRGQRRAFHAADDAQPLSLSPQHDAAKALTHPLRAAILERLYAREALPIQPSAPSRWVRERQVRGAVEHTYTATGRISLKQEPL